MKPEHGKAVIPKKLPRKPTLDEKVRHNWSIVQPHMPPWLNLVSKIPLLCHEFKLRIKLSGGGHDTGKPYASATPGYCILFRNLLIVCQGKFKIPDDTAPPTRPNTSGLGFIFLQNMKSSAMVQKAEVSGGKELDSTAGFILNFGPGDSMTFIPQDSSSTFQSWCDTLQTCFVDSSDVQVDQALIEVHPNKI